MIWKEQQKIAANDNTKSQFENKAYFFIKQRFKFNFERGKEKKAMSLSCVALQKHSWSYKNQLPIIVYTNIHPISVIGFLTVKLQIRWEYNVK